MEFNNTGLTNDAIIQNCESLSNLGNGGISGNTTLLAKFTGWINQSWGEIAMAILTVDKSWRWDDSNYTNPNGQPVATTDLISGQRSLILPRATNTADMSTLWKVYKVRIKDTNGDWYDLTPLAADADETDNDSGRPTKYRLSGMSIRLSDPPTASGVTLTAGIQVWFQRSFVPFTISDTTKQPSFLSSYHYILPLMASSKFLLPTNTALANEYITLAKADLENLKNSYATRNDDTKTLKRMAPNVEDTR